MSRLQVKFDTLRNALYEKLRPEADLIKSSTALHAISGKTTLGLFS